MARQLRIATGILAALVVMLVADSVEAQYFGGGGGGRSRGRGRVPHYQRTPTISPYTSLFRGNTGGLNSYFAWTRPIQNQQRNFANQARRNSYMQSELQYQQQGGMQSDRRLMMRPSAGAGAVPMEAGSYFNYSHFYPPGGGVGVPQGR